ncbi:FO synthase subunit 1 [Clarias magur]|uniref:FO synthase subunit 1 n=1 Tax=Clarias magur TaxID=1594786 RepID=A0A8J4U4I8_CLAMG|nr:FO synthase subunit 1 [Clarias magur]
MFPKGPRRSNSCSDPIPVLRLQRCAHANVKQQPRIKHWLQNSTFAKVQLRSSAFVKIQSCVKHQHNAQLRDRAKLQPRPGPTPYQPQTK